MKKLIISLAAVCLLMLPAAAQWYKVPESEYSVEENISYSDAKDEYSLERCKLDVYWPKDLNDCPVVVWFHGGGLTSGQKYIPEQLMEQGIAVVTVNYRLMPKVEIADCIDDAAAAVAWTFRNISRYNGDPAKIFVSGHSAGGYLTSMVGLEKKWLEKYGVDADNILALVPFSGQMITHFAHRDKQGISNLQPTIDEWAPLFHVRDCVPPFVMITGDREQEMFGRYEENAYMARMMKLVGHEETYLYELDGYNHGDMAGPAFPILLKHIRKMCK